MGPYEQVSFVVVSIFVLTQQVFSCGQQGGMGMLIPSFGGGNNHGLIGIPVFTNHHEKTQTHHHHQHQHQHQHQRHDGKHHRQQREKEKKSNSMVTYRKEDSDVSHLKLYDHSSENKPLLIHKEDSSEQTKDARRPLKSFGWGMTHGRKWPKPVKTPRTTTTVIPTTQSERQQQQLQRQKSQKEEKKKKIGNVIDSLLGMSLMGAPGGGEVVPPKNEEHHKKRDPEPAFPVGQMVTSHSQYTVETDEGALTCMNPEKGVHRLFGSECTHSSCKNKEWDGSCVDVHILMTILINQCQFTPEKQCPKKGDSLSSIEDIICENPEELVKTLVQLSNSDCTPSCKNQHSAKTNLNNPVV